MIEGKLKNLHILFITHTYATGFSQMFREWTKGRVKTFICIEHPLLPTWGTKTIISSYKNGKLQKIFSIPRFGRLWVLNYILDTIISIMFGIFLIKTKIDLSIGADNLNTLALLTLKKLDKVKKVIYHTVDYSPHRFENYFLNNIYHAIDRICCYNADMLWNSSQRMNEGRVKNGVKKEKIAHTIVTPDGSNFDPKKRLQISKIDRKKLIFLGHMRSGMGVEFILASMEDILEKVPDAKLLLIGGGPKLEGYKKLACDLGLDSYVSFTGFVEKHEDVDDLLRTGAIGLAPFVPDKSAYEYYSDVGKPKAYLAAGMPVVIMRLPEIADEINEKKAGFAINYKKEEFIKAIVSLLQDDALYSKYRTNAISLSEKYIWSNIFLEAYKKTLDFLKRNNKR